eukprot:scaffold61145_cov64-Phaeocystis_antarctica.AAC.3
MRGVRAAPNPNLTLTLTLTQVLVHRDEHWLVRDLALQREGVRIGADGTRCVGKFSRREAADGWEVVDQETRKVRRLQADEGSDEDEED